MMATRIFGSPIDIACARGSGDEWICVAQSPPTAIPIVRNSQPIDTTRPFIFSIDGIPVGYIQYWFIGHHQNETWIKDHPWLGELPAETVGVDLSIGVPGLLSQGIGSAALRAFVEGLRDEGHGTIVIDPDPENKRAVRAYMKAGFRPVPELVGRTGDVLIMQYDPNANEIS